MWPFKQSKTSKVRCVFSPEEDITALETARMLRDLVRHVGMGTVDVPEEVLEQQDYGRHFRPVKDG